MRKNLNVDYFEIFAPPLTLAKTVLKHSDSCIYSTNVMVRNSLASFHRACRTDQIKINVSKRFRICNLVRFCCLIKREGLLVFSFPNHLTKIKEQMEPKFSAEIRSKAKIRFRLGRNRSPIYKFRFWSCRNRILIIDFGLDRKFWPK